MTIPELDSTKLYTAQEMKEYAAAVLRAVSQDFASPPKPDPRGGKRSDAYMSAWTKAYLGAYHTCGNAATELQRNWS